MGCGASERRASALAARMNGIKVGEGPSTSFIVRRCCWRRALGGEREERSCDREGLDARCLQRTVTLMM